MRNKYLLLLLLSSLCSSVEIVTGESFNGKDVLSSYEYTAKYITPKEIIGLVNPTENKPILGHKYVAMLMTKKANAGSVLLQFTCRVEGGGKSEVATVYASHIQVNAVDVIMIPTRLDIVDRIVVTGCIVK